MFRGKNPDAWGSPSGLGTRVMPVEEQEIGKESLGLPACVLKRVEVPRQREGLDTLGVQKRRLREQLFEQLQRGDGLPVKRKLTRDLQRKEMIARHGTDQGHRNGEGRLDAVEGQ